MKKIRVLISVLAALVLAMTALCCAAGETALAQQIIGTWEVTEIRGIGALGDDQMATVMELARAFGGSITFTFREDGTFAMTMAILGQSDTQEGSYSAADGMLNIEGAETECTVNGDEMILSGSMVLTRVDGSAAAAPAQAAQTAEANELTGDWEVVSVYVAEGSADTLAARIEPFVNEGSRFKLAFTADKVSIEIMGIEDQNAETSPYTLSGDTLTIGGAITMTWQIYEGRLLLTEGSDVIGLERMGTEAQPAETAEAAPEMPAELVREWKVVSVYAAEGSTDTLASRIAPFVEEGQEFTLTFTKNEASIGIAGSGQEPETVPCTADAETLTIGGTISMTWQIYEGRLLLTEGSDVIGLEPAEAEAAAPATVEGSWLVTEVTGSDEYNTIITLGGSVTMTFSEGKCTMDAELLGMTSSQEGTYEDGIITMNDGAKSGYELDGDTLLISDGTVTMMLARK